MIGAATMIAVQREMSFSSATTMPSRTAIPSASLSRRWASHRVRLVGAGVAGCETAGWLTRSTLPRRHANPTRPAAPDGAARAVGSRAVVEQRVDDGAGAADV